MVPTATGLAVAGVARGARVGGTVGETAGAADETVGGAVEDELGCSKLGVGIGDVVSAANVVMGELEAGKGAAGDVHPAKTTPTSTAVKPRIALPLIGTG